MECDNKRNKQNWVRRAVIEAIQERRARLLSPNYLITRGLMLCATNSQLGSFDWLKILALATSIKLSCPDIIFSHDYWFIAGNYSRKHSRLINRINIISRHGSSNRSIVEWCRRRSASWRKREPQNCFRESLRHCTGTLCTGEIENREDS